MFKNILLNYIFNNKVIIFINFHFEQKGKNLSQLCLNRATNAFF